MLYDIFLWLCCWEHVTDDPPTFVGTYIQLVSSCKCAKLKLVVSFTLLQNITILWKVFFSHDDEKIVSFNHKITLICRRIQDCREQSGNHIVWIKLQSCQHLNQTSLQSCISTTFLPSDTTNTGTRTLKLKLLFLIALVIVRHTFWSI